MAKTNYSFEKRQRELNKKRSKEEKAAIKAGGQGGGEVKPGDAPAVPAKAVDDVPPPVETETQTQTQAVAIET